MPEQCGRHLNSTELDSSELILRQIPLLYDSEAALANPVQVLVLRVRVVLSAIVLPSPFSI